MNFQTVRSVEGQVDEKGYPAKVQMFGIIVGLEAVAYTPKGQKFQQVMIQDDAGEQNKVKIWLGKATGLPMAGRHSFQVSPNSFKGKMYYSGFWNENAQVAQSPQTVGGYPIVPKAPQITPYNAPKPPQVAPQSAKPDWDAIADGKVRHGLTVAYIESGREPDYTNILKYLQFIKTGLIPIENPKQLNTDSIGEMPEDVISTGDDNNIPWEH